MASSSRKILGMVKPNRPNVMRGFSSRPFPTNAGIPEVRASVSKAMVDRFSVGGGNLHSAKGNAMIRSEIGKMKIDQRKYYSVWKSSENGFGEMEKVKRENLMEMHFFSSAELEDMKEKMRQYELNSLKMSEMMSELHSDNEKMRKLISKISTASSENHNNQKKDYKWFDLSSMEMGAALYSNLAMLCAAGLTIKVAWCVFDWLDKLH